MQKVIIPLLLVCLLITLALWLRAKNELEALREATTASPGGAVVVAEINRNQTERVPTFEERQRSSLPDLPIGEAALESDDEPLVVVPVVGGTGESPPMSEALASALSRFDVAMDREFDRLDKREGGSGDEAEVATIQQIKAALAELDELYRRADTAAAPEERAVIRQEMQATMGQIIGLARRDRNERIGKLATGLGYTNPDDVDAFVREVDRIYRETHMDWTKLFNRAPPMD